MISFSCPKIIIILGKLFKITLRKIRNIFLIITTINLMAVLFLPSLHSFSHENNKRPSNKSLDIDVFKQSNCRVCDFHLNKVPEADFLFFEISLFTVFFQVCFGTLKSLISSYNQLSFQLRAPPSI